MFRKMFGGGASQSEAYEAGQRLFHEAMAAATEYRTSEAIALYTRSFEKNPNPAPLINRAKLYRWRLQFEEAIRDLEIALRLDKQQGDQFGFALGEELRDCKVLATNRFNGQKDLFITDLANKGYDHVSARLVDSIFKGDGQLLGYHMVNEIDNVKKFEVITDFPAVKILLDNWMKDQTVIDSVLSNPGIRAAYLDKRMIFEMMICVYEHTDMVKMRDIIVRKIWCLLNPPSIRQALWEFGLREPIGS